MNLVGPGYFDTMGMRLVAGRDFRDDDDAGNEVVLIVNEAFANRVWPGESPIGKMIAATGEEPTDRIIGVVANADYNQLGQDPELIYYASALQNELPYANFVASTGGSAAAMATEMQKAILEIDPDLSFPRVTTIEATIADEVGTYALGARAVGSFGLLAALLASVGLYGVLSFLVAARTREIGIRMALGSTTRDVLTTVLGSGLRLATVGVVFGVVAALFTVRWIAGMLYGISPYDPISFVGVPVLLLGIAAIASLMPARRASRVDPLEALRAD
jgi:predicted permease